MRFIVLAAAVAAATAAGMPARAQMPGVPGGMGNPGGAGARPGMTQPGEEVDRTPQPDQPDVAVRRAYREGTKSLQKGMEYEAAAAKAASPDKRVSEIEKAANEYYHALDYFTEALSGNAEMY
jgi:hypothetical protein